MENCNILIWNFQSAAVAGYHPTASKAADDIIQMDDFNFKIS
jgi:hypothetical protein